MALEEVNNTDPPEQTEFVPGGVTEGVAGVGFTVSCMLLEAEHPCGLVTVTVYEVVTVGLAMGCAYDATLSPAAGDQA